MKVKSIYIKSLDVTLTRENIKKEEIVAWLVHNQKRKKDQFLGIICQVYDNRLVKRVGHQTFPVKFWIYSTTNKHGAANTRMEIIYKLLSEVYPNLLSLKGDMSPKEDKNNP